MPDNQSSTGIGCGRLLVGLAGRGILDSRSPWMHEREAEAHEIRMIYALFDFTDRRWTDDDLPALLTAAERIGFSGLNVTFPFKQAVIPLLDDLCGAARAIGAVNTIAFKGGRVIGHNTDVTAFADAFRSGLAGASRDTVLQLGCGGAGSATANALLGLIGVQQLLLADPDQHRADALFEQLATAYGRDRVRVVRDTSAAAREADGLLNASPVGMAKFPGLPLPPGAIEPRHWVADIVYFPLETSFLAEARRKGCQTLDGSGMAVGQAADAFEIFTGRQADRQRMSTSFASFTGPSSLALADGM